MAKGNGERPAKKGTKDPLLGELQRTLNQPKPAQEAPVELKEIYGDSVPSAILEMYGKLKGKGKKESYLGMLRADIAEKVRKEKEKAQEGVRQIAEANAAAKGPTDFLVGEPTVQISPEAQKLEAEEQAEIDKRIETAQATDGELHTGEQEPFDPHSVQSAVSVEEQERNKEIRELFAQGGVIAPESVSEPGIDTDDFSAPQYAPRDMQEEADELNGLHDGVEGTPKEWREKLRALIERAGGKTKEKVEWWKSSEEGLIRRNEELDAQLEKVGGVEKGFRWVGEKYNKLGWKSKLAVGAGLGLGAVVTAGSLAMVFPLLGIATQRAAGLATMYLKFEKSSHDEVWGKNKGWGKQKAMLKAGAYTVLLGLTMKEAIEYASQTELAHAAQAKVEGWLGVMLGHKPVPSELPKATTMPEQAPAVAQAPRVEAPVAPEQPAAAIGHQASADVQAAAMSPRPEGTPASATAPESTPLVSVVAEAPQPATAPEAVPVVQEAKPLTATAPETKEPVTAAQEVAKPEADEGIVITEIQVPVPEPTEPFVAPTETADTLHAPAEVSAASATEPEAPVAVVVDELPKETVTSWPPIPKEGLIDLTEAQDLHQQELNAARAAEAVETTEEPSAPPAEVSAADTGATQPVEELSAPETAPLEKVEVAEPNRTVQTVDVTNAPELVSQPHVETPPEAPLESPAPAPTEQINIIQNQFGLTIPMNETHLYEGAGGKDTFVFGGTAQEKARVMLEFFKEHPTKIIYSADETGTKRIPWRFIQGQLVPDKPAQEGWLFARTLMKAPSPDDLAKVIK